MIGPEHLNEKTARRRALVIGLLCVSSYVVNYYLRQLLGVFKPTMTAGEFTTPDIGVLSAAYMLFYAAGQFLNGFLGDYLSPKWMAFAGVFFSGGAAIVFSFLRVFWLQVVCFAVFGYALSMVRGPFMKVISENTLPDHARLICVFFSASAFFGPLIASVLAFFFPAWRTAFAVGGGIGVAMSFLVLTVLTLLEKRGVVSYHSTRGTGLRGMLSVFSISGFWALVLISCINEIGATSITFWVPTYLTEQLGFEKNVANTLFSVIAMLRSAMPFCGLFLYKITRGRDNAIMRAGFTIMTALLCLMAIFPESRMGIGLFVPVLLCSGIVSSMLWSIYIPSLGKTGHVSSANGVLDGSGYIAAAGSNLAVSFMLVNAGWVGVFLFWAGIFALGFCITFMRKKKD